MTDEGEWERFTLKGPPSKRVYLRIDMPDDERRRLNAWCEANCQGLWWISDRLAYASFQLEDDAMLCKMVWG